MKNSDLIQRFLFDENPIRGQLVSLNQSWREILKLSDADGYARTILGHALTAVALLSSTLKFNGNITLQIQGQGALNLLVAQASSEKTVRGIVKQTQAIKDNDADLSEVFASDKIVITIDTGKGRPHQGIVPLQGNKLATALETYFQQSEQLQTHLWLACDDNVASGLLIQKLPGEMHDPDAWNRVIQLANTITDRELIELDTDELVYRLFHEDKVRIFEPEPVRFQCNCSTQRTLGMLKTLGRQELEDILQQESNIDVTCEFCNRLYRFDALDVEHLFKSPAGLETDKTRH